MNQWTKESNFHINNEHKYSYWVVCWVDLRNKEAPSIVAGMCYNALFVTKYFNLSSLYFCDSFHTESSISKLCRINCSSFHFTDFLLCNQSSTKQTIEKIQPRHVMSGLQMLVFGLTIDSLNTLICLDQVEHLLYPKMSFPQHKFCISGLKMLFFTSDMVVVQSSLVIVTTENMG